MRTIALIEDDVSAQNDIKRFLLRYGEEKGEDFSVSAFSSAEQFLTGYKADYDLIIMDIMLTGMNGMDAAKKLRELDKDTVLVFVTNMAQFAVGGYSVGAFDFILKPVTYASFYLKFIRIMDKIKSQDGAQLVIKGKQFSRRIYAADIIYVEVADHDLVYHTSSGNVTGHGSMRAVESALKGNNFVLCNQSYLVNLKYVEELRASEVKAGGDWLVISRPKKKSFTAAVEKYFHEKRPSKSDNGFSDGNEKSKKSDGED